MESRPRSKRKRPGDLSSRRTIINNFKPKPLESIYFNSGLMPENSWRCLDCKSGFTLTYHHLIKLCPDCGSDNLIEYNKAKLAEQVDEINRERNENTNDSTTETV